MTVALLTTVIAVIGTLLGSVVTGYYQQRATTHADHEARRRELHRERTAAITTLAEAVSAHRTLMWRRGEAKIRGDQTRYEDLRSQSHETRAAVTAPHVALLLLITDGQVRAAADDMIRTTYAIRNHDADTSSLDAARFDAISAYDAFVNTAALYMQAQAA